MKRRHPMSSRDHATELVESYILDMGLRPGDRLPSERDMCRMWDLNRTTLRNAIQRLVSDGVLYCRMGSGTYVAQPKLVRNLQDVKGFSEAVRETGRTPGARLVYCRQCEADKAITKRLHVSLGSPVVELCRVRTIDGVPVAMETTCLNEHLFPDIERYDFRVYRFLTLFAMNTIYRSVADKSALALQRSMSVKHIFWIIQKERRYFSSRALSMMRKMSRLNISRILCFQTTFALRAS